MSRPQSPDQYYTARVAPDSDRVEKEAGSMGAEPSERSDARDDTERETSELVPKLDLSDSPKEPLPTTQMAGKKILSIWGYLTLRGFFHLVGRSVGAYPFVYIILALLLSLNSGGMYWMVLKDRIRDGYTPINAPSRYETDVIREFWNSSGDPMMTILIMLARDGGSMHRKEYLDEADSLVNFLYNNFTVEYKDEKLKFADMCEPYCNMNKVFEMFKEGFDSEYKRAIKGEPPSADTELNFPVANINGFEIHLERSLFGVRLKEEGANRTIEEAITNMEHVEVLLILFRGDKGSVRHAEQLSKWEIAAYDFSLQQYNSSLVELQVVGTEILDNEMIRDGRRMTPFFAAGFGFMISFVSICVYGSAVFYDEVDRGKM